MHRILQLKEIVRDRYKVGSNDVVFTRKRHRQFGSKKREEEKTASLESGVSTLTSDRPDFKIKSVTRDKNRRFGRIKRSINHEDTSVAHGSTSKSTCPSCAEQTGAELEENRNPQPETPAHCGPRRTRAEAPTTPRGSSAV